MSTVKRNTIKKSETKAEETKQDEKKHRPRTQIEYTHLHVVESGLYWAIWLTVLTYIMYLLYKASDEYKHDVYHEDLGNGWKIIGRQKDVSDFEWEFWLKFASLLLASFGLNYICGMVMSYIFPPEFKSRYYLLFSLIFITALLGIRPVLFLIVHCLIMYMCALTGSGFLVWVASLSILTSLHSESARLWQFQYLTQKQELSDFTLFVALMSILRCLSFSLDSCWREDVPNGCSYSFLDFLSYNFYLPLFTSGPVMTYNTFHIQFHQPHRSFTKGEIMSLVWDSIRTLFWFIFFEVYLHFMYSTALIRMAPVAKRLSGWALSGVFYSQLHIFLTKYVVMYRLSGLFARLDRLDAPEVPRCVSTLYSFTDMWRYFDRGLNVWMKRYIYIPMGGSRRGLFRQLIGSFLAFGFVWEWHGGSHDNIWWFVSNWLGVAIEGLVLTARNHPRVIELQDRLSPRMRRRVHAMICVIPCACLVLSNMVFLIGPLPVVYYIKKIFYHGFPVSTLVCLSCLYLSVQTNMDLNYYKGGQW